MHGVDYSGHGHVPSRFLVKSFLLHLVAGSAVSSLQLPASSEMAWAAEIHFAQGNALSEAFHTQWLIAEMI